MNELVMWVATVLSSITAAVLLWVGRVLTRLPIDYMPRDQINGRFEAIRAELKEDILETERRTDKRFDRVDEALNKILDKLDGKADK